MKQYFFYNGTEKHGPLTFNELKLEKISRDTLIWFEGLDDWKPANDIVELKAFFELIPPPIDENNKNQIIDDHSPRIIGGVLVGALRQDDTPFELLNNELNSGEKPNPNKVTIVNFGLAFIAFSLYALLTNLKLHSFWEFFGAAFVTILIPLVISGLIVLVFKNTFSKVFVWVSIIFLGLSFIGNLPREGNVTSILNNKTTFIEFSIVDNGYSKSLLANVNDTLIQGIEGDSLVTSFIDGDFEIIKELVELDVIDLKIHYPNRDTSYYMNATGVQGIRVTLTEREIYRTIPKLKMPKMELPKIELESSLVISQAENYTLDVRYIERWEQGEMIGETKINHVPVTATLNENEIKVSIPDKPASYKVLDVTHVELEDSEFYDKSYMYKVLDKEKDKIFYIAIYIAKSNGESFDKVILFLEGRDVKVVLQGVIL